MAVGTARAARPWVIRTALGAPVEPDVNNNANSVSGSGAALECRLAGPDGFGRRGAGLCPRGAVDVEDAVSGEIERDPVEQGPHGVVGDDQLAVGVIDVAGELRAAAGRVDTNDRRAGEPGAHQQEDELRHVLEQHPDVERPGPAQLRDQLGADARLRDDLAPRPSSIFVVEPVAVVLRATQDQVGEGDRCRVH